MSNENNAVSQMLETVTKNIEDTSNYIEKTAEEDFVLIRQNILDNIELNKTILEKLADIAETEEHPRWYEMVLAAMRDNTALNEKLLDISKKLKDIKQKNEKQGGSGDTINNTLVFNGSTKDLQRFLSKQNLISPEVIDVTPEE